MRSHWLWALLLCVGASAPAQAAERLPDRRQVPAPVVSTQSMVTQEQLLDLLRQLETQQMELRQLQNQVEVQANELEKLKGRQRDLINDMDRRIQLLERRPVNTGEAPRVVVPERTTAAIGAAEQQDYDTAFALLKQGQYERAIRAFREFLGRYPKGGLADNAQYWIAEGNYVLHEFKSALSEFTKLTQVYPDSAKLPDALLKIGYIHQELGDRDKARKALEELTRRYPTSNAAKIAEKRLAKDAR